MIVLGVLLLVASYGLEIHWLWTVGAGVTLVGLLLLGRGVLHPRAGRRRWWF